MHESAPDVAYVSRERFPERSPVGFPELVPDLAIEVRSPDDHPGELLAKVGDWISAGTQLVWVVDAAREAVAVYRSDGTVTVLRGADVIDGEMVLPGFSLALTELFAPG